MKSQCVFDHCKMLLISCYFAEDMVTNFDV